MSKKKFAVVALALTLAGSLISFVEPVKAGNTTFLTDKNGNQVFPISPPTRSPAAPGAIDNMTIGGATQAPIGASTIKIDSGTKTATATSGAATLNKSSGAVTSESLTTAAAAVYTLTITNSAVAAADTVQVTLGAGTNTGGAPVISTATAAVGSIVVKVLNAGSTALNGNIVAQFVVLKN